MTATVPLDRQRWAWRALALVPALVLATFVANESVPAAIRFEAVVVLVVTMVRPSIGLMLVALLAPLGDMVVPLLGAPLARQAETLVVAFLAGWLSTAAGDDELRPRLPVSLAAAMWVFGGVLIASAAATSLQLQRESPTQLRYALAALARAYLLIDDLVGAHTVGRLLEGLGLIGAATQIARRDPRDRFWLLLALVVSGVLVGTASSLLAIGVAPAGTLARQIAVGLPRYSAIVTDVNATASFYLLLIGVSIGMAISIRRTRMAWLLAAAIMTSGLTLTGSGAAFVAGAFVVSAAAIWWILSGASRRRTIVAALALVTLLAAAIAFTRTPRSTSSLEMRGGFTQASVRLIEARPVFGVGAGRYYSLSRLVLPPRLAWFYGLENAHDYFLQTAAELGLAGLIVFGWLLLAALRAPFVRVWRGRADGVTMGCVGGLLAYLVTALAGHPFLVEETAIPFWIVLGVLVAQQAVPAVRSRWPRRAAIGFGCALLVTMPLRGAVPQVRVPPGEDGFGPLETDNRGRPFRAAGVFASLFVGADATEVEIPMRVERGAGARAAIVGVKVPGALVTELRVGDDWSTVRIPLPGAEVLVPRQRINLAVSQVEDGKPPAGPPRVDVGQIRLVTTR